MRYIKVRTVEVSLTITLPSAVLLSRELAMEDADGLFLTSVFCGYKKDSSVVKALGWKP